MDFALLFELERELRGILTFLCFAEEDLAKAALPELLDDPIPAPGLQLSAIGHK